ncbi:MAG: hypothetical protein ACD_76C00066G0003 [uncultured bacterium]|nr:MAG: hypothetical protein ACD_76C00066G0003 [uncultured bacterium]HBD05737.1 hypothetical protein [Candidatus Uhrbacteria bacterium]
MKLARIILPVIALGLLFPFASFAQDRPAQRDVNPVFSMWAGVSPDCQSFGTCSLADVLEVTMNIGNAALGISGSIALVVFIWGGFLWLTSAGKSEKVQKGRKAMFGAAIGLLIVFAASLLINTVKSFIGAVPQEICSDGKDNDDDGFIDENCTQEL